MATVPFQASPFSTLFWEPKSSEFVRGRLGGIDRQLSAVSVSSSGIRIGERGAARSLLALEDSIPTGLREGKSRVRAKHLEWRGGRSWSRVRTQREVTVRALDGGDFSSRKNAKDRSLEKLTGDKNYRSFFRDQVYDHDRGNDFYLDYSTPDEGIREVSGEVETFIRNEGLEEPVRGQGDAAERRASFRNREWVQVDDEGGRPESSVSQTKEGGYNGNLDYAGQRFSQAQGLSYTPNPVSESRPIVEERKKSRIDFRKPRDYDNVYESRGSPPYELGAVEEYRGRPAADFDDRYDLESSGKDEISEIEDDEQQGQVPPNSGSIRRERTSTTIYGREVEQEESARGVLYAKQVISLATAQSVGFVTQLWVDVDNLKVVALEVRPSLLFGDFCSFPLNSISKVGDVILIQDDDIILGQRELFNCSDLVGNAVFTEDGIDLGKVRDYNFSLEDGAVLSIEFDTFGVPLIPSKLVKTYSLTVDEVLENQQDGLLVRRGAEKRVQKLSKGFLSRSKKLSVGRQSPRRQQRNQAPEIQYLGQTTEIVRGIAEWDNYTPGYSTRQQSKRGNIYSDGKSGFENESLRASRFESDQTSGLYPSSSFSSRSKDLNSDEFEDYQVTPSIRRELPVRDSPQISEKEETQGPNFGISTPDTGGTGRGLPMSYRTSRRRVENN